MADFNLFHMPGACSRVVLNALEEIGAPFEARAVNLMRGEHRSPEMLAVNPKGKVPALQVGSRLVTENPSILLYLDERFPDAGLLPRVEDPLDRAEQRSDLIWISNTVHPLVRAILMPQRVSAADADGVRSGAMDQLAAIAAGIDARLGGGRWWFGEAWSIVDVYIYWAMSTAAGAGFDLTPYPAIVAHAGRVRARPSFQRALAREQAEVDAGRATLPPGASL